MEIGLCYDALNSTEEALHNINKALNLSPNDLEYLYIQTGIYRKVGLYAEADLGYQKLLELGCDAPAIWLEYASLALSLNEIKDSINLLKQGLKHNNNHVDLLSNLGAYSFLAGELDAAKKYLQKVISINSSAIDLLYKTMPKLETNNDFKQLLK